MIKTRYADPEYLGRMGVGPDSDQQERNMELRNLRTFRVVARRGNLSRAAEDLHTVQPNVSRQLIELADEIGAPLFIRHKHGVSLTGAGARLLERVTPFLDHADRLEAALKDFDEEVAGDLTIGDCETNTWPQLFDAAKATYTRFPKIRYHIFSGDTAELLLRLDFGELDFAVLPEPFDRSGYGKIPLSGASRWGVLFRKDSVLARKRRLSLKDLADTPILLPREDGVNTAFQEWYEKSISSLFCVGTYRLPSQVVSIVGSGLCCACGLERSLVPFQGEKLKFVPFDMERTVSFCFTWREDRPLSRQAEVFLKNVPD